MGRRRGDGAGHDRRPRRRAAISTLTAVLLLVVACTSGAPPTAPPPTSGGGASGTATGGPDGGTEQRGFALPTYSRDGYGSAAAATHLGQIADSGAGWVQLNPTWFQDSPRDAEILAGEETPSDASLVAAVAEAHDVGLRVMLKPHVDLVDGTHRGEIDPADPTAWFASYRSFIGRYADLAARSGVDQFVVGTELEGVSDDRQAWLEVVGAVRARYSGPLLYAANYDEYRGVAFWDALDLIGIDAYFPLADRPTADATALESAWRPIRADLQELAAQADRQILFTEAGYTSQHGSTTAPYSWTISTRPDQAEQAAGYEALLTAFYGQPWWAGVHWWYWAVPLEENPNDPLGYAPRGKAAEDVLSNWWK